MSKEESTVAGQDNQDRNVRPRQNVLRPKNDENIDISRITIKTLDKLKDENVERRKTGIYYSYLGLYRVLQLLKENMHLHSTIISTDQLKREQVKLSQDYFVF